jgi:hypothetical protein
MKVTGHKTRNVFESLIQENREAHRVDSGHGASELTAQIGAVGMGEVHRAKRQP